MKDNIEKAMSQLSDDDRRILTSESKRTDSTGRNVQFQSSQGMRNNNINIIEEEDKEEYQEELKSPEMKRLGGLNRLSERLPDAIQQVDGEIKEVKDDIDSMITSIES